MVNPFKSAGAGGGSFLPEDYVSRKAEVRMNFLGLGLFAVVMLGVVGAFFVTNHRWASIREQQKVIGVQYEQEAQKIEQLKKLEEQRAQMMEKAEVTTALIERVPRSVLLAQLISTMPKDVTLLELSLKSKRLDTEPKVVETAKSKKPPVVKSLGKPDPKAAKADPKAKTGAKGEPLPEEKPKARPPKFEYTLTISGVAGVNNDIADYLQKLKASPILEKVDLQYIKETTLNDLQLRRFEILAQIRADADARHMDGDAPQPGVRTAGGKAGEAGAKTTSAGGKTGEGD